MLNTVALTGRLTKNPELRYSQTGTAFASATIAVDRSYTNQQGEREADFIRLSASGKRAEILANHFHKGELMGVEGSIKTGSYQGKNGQTIYTTDVDVRQLTFLTPKSQDSDGQQGYNQQNQGNYQGQQQGYNNQSQNNGYQDRNNQQGYGQQPGYNQQQNNAPFSDPGVTVNISDDDLPF